MGTSLKTYAHKNIQGDEEDEICATYGTYSQPDQLLEPGLISISGATAQTKQSSRQYIFFTHPEYFASESNTRPLRQAAGSRLWPDHQVECGPARTLWH